MTKAHPSGFQANQLETRKYFDGELHALLVRRMPELVRGGRINMHAFSETIGRARYTCYRWFQTDRLSPRAASRLIEIAQGRIQKEELAPFLID